MEASELEVIHDSLSYWYGRYRGVYSKKSSNNEIVISMLFVVSFLISLTLFHIDAICKKEVYKDMIKCLDLPIQDKVALGMVILSLLLVYYLFRKGRK